ncbi:cupin domain-containing protein [Cryptosporangium aurantiacum]|uniref:Cupin domain-containing protein n=1 Tax=Cryptosporangium aurantiacum TaxID=134849 RepID=A0A1M7R3W5_9ACTN|nr:cupin domain-containing protein [Cryptosporangium aurantiacum]SHN39630.1 Cupin domain-containing protein [Cryptosporangium aurantiacum]
MPPEDPPQLARLIVTGTDEQNRSVIVSDTPTPTWVRRPTGTVIMDLWQTKSLPAQVDDDSHDDGDESLRPPVGGGVCVRVAIFPPDKDVDAAATAEYEAAATAIYGEQGDDGPGDGAPARAVPGMHRTDTVDVVTVLDGEIWMVMDEGETLLRTGDCIVQRGTRHAWSNRSDRPCTLVSTMLAAERRS